MISRKKSLFLSVSVLILFVALVAQSCSSENDDFVANPNSSLEMRANLESMDNRATIVNSIAESDELLDYGMNCLLLAEKLKSYTSTLTPEEFDELMNNLNNDDYMIELVSKVDIEKEALMVENARQELLANKSFKLLDESEKMNVFIRFSDNSQNTMQHLLLKSPGESAGGVTKAECKRRYDEDYAYASAIYLSSMLLCSCATGGLGVCLCAIGASAGYDYATTLADRSYYDCLSNAIDR